MQLPAYQNEGGAPSCWSHSSHVMWRGTPNNTGSSSSRKQR